MQKAPDFKLLNQNEQWCCLQDYAGSWLVLYFYPKDDTPACTAEACSFRDGRDELMKLGVKVVGISKDSVKSHAKFASKHDLTFDILADPEHETIEAYGSWQLKKFMGREYMGTMRDTFLINPKGILVKKYAGIDPKTHFEELVKDVRQLQ